MSRPLVDVVEAVKNQIPDSFDKKEALLEKIDTVLEKELSDDTPEKKANRWMALSIHLDEFLGENDKPWKGVIEDIMTAKVDYKDYL